MRVILTVHVSSDSGGGHCLSHNFLKNPFSLGWLIERVPACLPACLEAVALSEILVVHLGALSLVS